MDHKDDYLKYIEVLAKSEEIIESNKMGKILDAVKTSVGMRLEIFDEDKEFLIDAITTIIWLGWTKYVFTLENM